MRSLRGLPRRLPSTDGAFFNDTGTTKIYTLSLHDALPISAAGDRPPSVVALVVLVLLAATLALVPLVVLALDRKSTRLNSSHANISHAVFCLKKQIGRAHV